MTSSRRTLNTWDATALTVGTMVGAGIFTILSLTVRTAGPSAVFSWILVVVLSLPMALTFSDLTGVLAESGGPYVYLRTRTRPWLGLAVGWSFFLSSIGAAAALLIALCGMLSELGVAHGYVAGVSASACLAVVAAFGLHVGARVQRVFTLATVGLLGLCIAIGMAHMHGVLPTQAGASKQAGTWLEGLFPHGWPAVLPAAFYAFWTYSGWEAVAIPSGSYKSRADLAKGMMIGSLLVGVLYVLVAFSTVVSVPESDIGTHLNPLVLVAALWNGPAAKLVGWGAVLIVAGSLLSWLLSTATLAQALIRDGLFPAPRFIRKTAGEYHWAVPFVVVAVLALCARLPIFSLLIAASSMTALLAYAAVFATVASDRRASWTGVIRSPRRRRVLAWWSLAMSGALIAFSGWNNLWPTLVMLGVGVVLVWFRRGADDWSDLRINTPRQTPTDSLPNPKRL